MSDGRVVGKISIKVEPDTTGFRGELKRQLDTIEKTLQGEVGVSANFDSAGLTEKVKAAAKAAESDVKVKADVDTSLIKKKLGEVNLAFERQMRSAMDIKPLVADSFAGMRRKLGTLDLGWDRKIKEAVESFKPQKLKLELDDQFDFRIRQRLAKFTKDPGNGLKLQLDNDFDFRLRQRLAKINAKVKVDADVDRSFSSRINGLINKIPSPNFGSGINPAGYAAILAGIMVVAAPLVGLVTTALLALPGLIALVGAPIAAIMLGMDGLKKAAEVLKAPFTDLKATMSAAAETKFLPVFEKLKEVFPTLKASLPGVTAGLADMAQGFADAVTRPENLAKIESIITNISTALSNAKPGIDAFTTGLINLADKLSQKFPAITEWFNGAGKSFTNWVTKITTPVAGIGGGLGGGKSPLDTAFEGLGGVLKTCLDLLGKLGEKGIEFMSDPSNIEKVKGAFTGIADAIQRIMDLSAGFFTVMDKIENSSQNQTLEKKGTGAFLQEGISPGNLLGPNTTEGFNQKLKDAFNPDNFLGPDTGEKIKAAFNLDNLFGDGTTGGLGQKLKDAFSVDNLGTEMSTAWETIKGTASTAWNTIVSTVTTAWNNIVSGVTTGIGNVITEVTTLPGKILGALGSLATLLIGAGAGLMGGLLDGIKQGFEAVKTFVGGIAQWIKDHKGPISFDKIVLIPNGQALMDGLGVGMENGFQPVLDQAKGMAQQIADAFASGQDPTGLLAGFSKDEIKRMESTLGLETRKLENQAKAIDLQASLLDSKDPLKDVLQNRAKDIRLQKDGLGLQKDMLDLTKDYSDELSDAEDPFVKAASRLMSSPVDFAKATSGQFLSDIGLNGDGFISKALTEGVKYIFNVGSVDDALAVKKKEDNLRALQWTGR